MNVVKYILTWFWRNRPEIDMKQDEALDFYEEKKDQLNLIEMDNDREAVGLLLESFLERYYSSPTKLRFIKYILKNN
ncbi:hypothetical protein CAPN009_12860 [Capnocytophaga canimorsus]|nr:hypothetical protein CAPN009_12860 [Capnocytophaga canimorsus]